MLKPLVVAILVMAAWPGRVFAWGAEGHRIVAEIAEQFLQPTTARQVRQLLLLENETTLASVSSWADDIRRQRRNTASWHFVDIPIHPEPGTPTAYDAQRDCPRGNCVVAKIDEFISILRNKDNSPQERLEALKFLTHFIGDIHQPLHCSNDDDRGGNAIRLAFLGHRTNLHAIWDTAIIAAAVGGDERFYALKLARTLTDKQVAAWRGGSARDWANESYQIARSVIYGRLPRNAGRLPEDYEQKSLPIVNDQLEKAGVRLAAVLNSVMR